MWFFFWKVLNLVAYGPLVLPASIQMPSRNENLSKLNKYIFIKKLAPLNTFYILKHVLTFVRPGSLFHLALNKSPPANLKLKLLMV